MSEDRDGESIKEMYSLDDKLQLVTRTAKKLLGFAQKAQKQSKEIIVRKEKAYSTTLLKLLTEKPNDSKNDKSILKPQRKNFRDVNKHVKKFENTKNQYKKRVTKLELSDKDFFEQDLALSKLEHEITFSRPSPLPSTSHQNSHSNNDKGLKIAPLIPLSNNLITKPLRTLKRQEIQATETRMVLELQKEELIPQPKATNQLVLKYPKGITNENLVGYIRVLSWNLAHHSTLLLNDIISPHLIGLRPDIICLQEMKPDVELLKESELGQIYQHIYISEFTMILSTFPAIEVVSVEQHSNTLASHIIALKFARFSLINVYALNPRTSKAADRMKFDDKIHQFLEKNFQRNHGDPKRRSPPLIVIGDFNAFSDFNLDCSNPHEMKELYEKEPLLQKVCENFNQLISRFGLFDPFRIMHPMERKFTYKNRANTQLQLRLDYALISGGFQRVLSATIRDDETASQRSDHCPIELLLSLKSEGDDAPTKIRNIIQDDEEKNKLRCYKKDLNELSSFLLKDYYSPNSNEKRKKAKNKYSFPKPPPKSDQEAANKEWRRKFKRCQTIKTLSALTTAYKKEADALTMTIMTNQNLSREVLASMGVRPTRYVTTSHQIIDPDYWEVIFYHPKNIQCNKVSLTFFPMKR